MTFPNFMLLISGCITLFLASACTSLDLEKPPAQILTINTHGIDLWPCFLEDGSPVLFSRSTNGRRTWEFFTISLSGGGIEKFSQSELPVSATRATWSAKRHLIAFTGTSTEGINSIWLINADGTKAQQLTPEGLSDEVYYPSWYPDGIHLAVLDWRDRVIKRINLISKRAVALTDRAQVLAGMPSVSPDGKWIAFAGQKNIGLPYDQTKNSIWLISSTGEVQTLEDPPEQGRTPAWSPDGHWLAFESNRGNLHGLYSVYIIRRDGTGLRRITSSEMNATHPAWSPDGRHIAFSTPNPEKRNAVGISVVHVRPE